jgi:putative hydrolase of the HAD superfamily
MLSSLPEIIFFDVYGTLFVSSLGDISVSKSHISPRHFYQTLKIAAYNPHNSAGTAARDLYYSTIEEIHTRLRNEKNSFPEVDIRAVWQQVITVLGKNELIFKTEQSLSTEEVSILFESLTNPVFPMPGLEETLSYLKEMNCIIGIISNAQFYTPSIFSAFTGKSVSQLGFQEQLCFFSYEYASAKPGTYLFNIAEKKIRNEFAAEGEIIYVGNDMLNDISAAKSAGFKTALFAGDKRSLRLRSDDPRCNDIKPDLVITDLRQLKWL